MPSKFPRFKSGDALTPKILNLIFAELDRWRQLSGSGFIGVDGADSNSAPRIADLRQSAWVPASLGGTLATGTPGSPTNAPATLYAPSSSPTASLTITGGTSITVYNTFPLTTSLASGTQIWVASYNNFWYLGQAGCP